METMKKLVKVGTVMHMTWRNCMQGWWSHNTYIYIFIYLIRGKGLQTNSVQCTVCICGKGVQINSVKCTLCIKWIHKRCSGLRGDLSLLADGFRCNRCDGTLHEADLAGGLVVDEETYKCVRSFLIWEPLLMEMVDACCVRSSTIYGSETTPLLADVAL